MRIRSQERSPSLGCFLLVVSVADLLLADRDSGPDSLSVRLAAPAAIPHCGDSGAWSSGLFARFVLSASAHFAWASRHLASAESRHLNFRVTSEKSLIC